MKLIVIRSYITIKNNDNNGNNNDENDAQNKDNEK